MNKKTWKLASVLMAAGFGLATMASPAMADKKTERKWKAKCASCHGKEGKGDTDQGKKMGAGDMTKKDFWKDIDEAKAKDAIAKGFKRKKNGKDQEMKAAAGLKPDEIEALAKYARGLAGL